MLSSVGLIALGVLLLVAGGEVLLRGAVGLATLLRLTPAVIGLTVVAAGTSVPELAVSGAAAYRGNTDITVANIIGSNIFNITVILGICALARPIRNAGAIIRLEYPVLALVTLLSLVLLQDGQVNRLDAVLCLAVYTCFTAYLISLVRHQVTPVERQGLRDEVQELTPTENHPRGWVCFLLVTAGVVLLTAGGHACVTGAVELARLLGWSERVIGLTIISAGTGLPEVAASLVSSARGRSDVALGNVIGSNLFNILIILGVNGLIVPLPVSPALVSSDCWWMLGVTLLLFPIVVTGSCVSRFEGCLLLAVYATYVGGLLVG